ncbi:MAG: hypothetical protein FVQ80_07020 [Planctomycetes bacterium]|nr:hypothetical protein [Planctomycetota bacterium]
MSFSFDPTSDRGKVRLYCHDTTDGTYGTDFDFSDADIDAFLEQESDSVWYASAAACRVLAVKATATAFLLKIPGAIELDKRQIAKIYLGLADKYQARADGSAGGIVEYVDSFAILYDVLGREIGEFVGDPV